MAEFLWDELLAFVKDAACISSKKNLTESSEVVNTLGQYGDDADEFMEAFFKKFHVDRGDYDFCRYFFMEGEGLISHLFVKYIRRKPHSLKRESVTLGILYRAIESGKWDSGKISEHKYY